MRYDERETTLWRRTDQHSNGRWLYVERPDRNGEIAVGIEEVYQKYLDPDGAEAMAAALVTAAVDARAIKARLEVERQERQRLREQCQQLGEHEWGDWTVGDFACLRCGSQPETVAYTWAGSSNMTKPGLD